MAKRSLITMLEEVIHERHGKVRQSQFRVKAMDHFGRNPAFEENLESSQITLMNGFWRGRLAPLENSIHVRAWLEDCDSLDEWLNLCINNWLDDAIKLGALD